MKKLFVVTAVAMLLMAGSAMAEPVYMQGVLGFNGSADYDFEKNHVILANEYPVLNNPALSDPTYFLFSYLRTTLDFATLMPPSDWVWPGYAPGTQIPVDACGIDFGAGVGGNIELMGTCPTPLDEDNSVIFAAFTLDEGWLVFHVTEITEITPSADGGLTGVLLAFEGYVVPGGGLEEIYRKTDIRYTMSLDRAGGENPYGITLNMIAQGPPVVPEPGTLVLFGTGLIGATIVARRKMKK